MANYFLKIDGISGESQDAKHKGEIELASFSWGVAQPGAAAAAGRAAGKVAFQDFHFVMTVNKASPLLFLASASGKHIKEAYLSVRRAGKLGLEYLKIKFNDVLISSFEEAGGAEAPLETVAFNFGSIAMTYTPQDARGTAGSAVEAGWDLKKNTQI